VTFVVEVALTCATSVPESSERKKQRGPSDRNKSEKMKSGNEFARNQLKYTNALTPMT
jgi:hypothetical protein